MRAARQQDFLRQAKQQVDAPELIDEADKLMKIVGRYTRSDVKAAERRRCCGC